MNKYLNVSSLPSKMEVFIEKESKQMQVDFSGSVKELLDKIRVNAAEVLVVVNGELATDDDKVSENDKVKVLSVISGG